MTTAAPVRETENPYLNGNFAPVREEITALDLDVTGAIPEYLDGRYLRIGPNPIGDPDPARYHWFLGSGMAHGLRLRDGKAHWYRNRWVRSADVARKLGETWRGGPANGGFDFAANTNIIGQGGRTLAIVEAGARPYELTDELETVGPSDFCGTLFGGYTAHPKRDPVTGELHAVSYNPMRGNIVQYTVTGVDGKVRRTVDIRLQGADDDARLLADREVRRALRPSGGVGLRLESAQQAGQDRRDTVDPVRRTARRTGLLPARRDARVGARRVVAVRDALPLGPGTAGPRRRHATRGHRGRDPLVRGERVLRVPPAQRLRRRRSRWCWTSCGIRRCSPRAIRRRARQPDAGPVDRRPHHGQGRRGAHRRHGAGVSPRRRATCRPPAPLRILRSAISGDGDRDSLRPTRSSSTTSPRDAPSPTRSGPAANPASSSSSRPARTLPKTTVWRWASSTTGPPTAVTSCCSTRRRWKRSRRCTFRPACRTVFTAIGYRAEDLGPQRS